MKSSKKISKLLSGLCMSAALCTPMLSHAGVCPIAGTATDCNTLFTIGSGNSVATTFGPQSNYDGVEDNLVGVVNNSGGSIASMTLTGNNIFGFDNDGIATYTGIYSGSTGYEGPNTSFNIVDANNGSVIFTGGLANGATAYFSLEEQASASANGGAGVVGVTPSVPEPSELALLTLGVGLMGFVAARKSKAS